ncbi:MAG: ABC transporter substrate-binding protein [Caldilineaceae bacterium]|nr:ABC transporter substrate-binding protein [Caldilineaceae bacterium]
MQALRTSRFFVLLLALLVTLLAAACAAPAPAPSAGSGEEAATAEPMEESADAGEPSRVIVAQSVDLDTMEPYMISSRPGSNMYGHLFATLYDNPGTGELLPYAATGYTENEVGNELTFTLVEGLTCHDGAPLTADDVVYSFQRANDDANAFTGHVAGYVMDAMGYVDVREDSDLEVTVILENYNPLAIGLIADVWLLCRESYEEMGLEGAATNVVGSGPYKFVEWVKDDYLLMEKWDEFLLSDPIIDEIEWKVIPEASTRTAELIAGNVDIITNVPPDQHAAVDASGEAVVEGVAGTRRIYVGFNQRDIFEGDGAEAIKQTDVRVALQYAVDVPTICQTLLAFDCERATSMVNPPNDNPNLEPYPYDPAMAEELLDAAGYPRGEDGTRFSVAFQAGAGRYLNDVAVIQAIAQYLTDVGIDVDLQIMDFNAEFVPMLRQHEVGPLYLVGTGGSTWSGISDMADLSSPTGATNYTEWANPEWFSRWDQVSTTRDVELQKQLTNEMLEIFYNDPPWLLLYFQPDFYGVSTDLNWDPRRDEVIDLTSASMN